jgi:plasmid stabilization system protein ParE
MTAELTQAAFADLEDIDDYVTGNFGTSHAIATRRNLFHTFQLLADFPSMGVVRPRFRKMSVRFFHLKPYWIVYQPGDPLVIQRVYHAARDLNRLRLK